MATSNWLAVGDSWTFNNSTGLTLAQFWPAVLQSNLITYDGYDVAIDNQAQSGWGTGSILGFVNGYVAKSNPLAGFIYAGNNDFNASNIGTIQASPAPTSTTFTLDSGKGAVMPIGSSIFVGSNPARTISNVVGDAITISTALSTTPSAGASVNLDTVTNIVTIGTKMISLGYTKLYVCIQHYLNWSTSGDFFWISGTGQSGNERDLAQNAARILGATTIDFYWYMRLRILQGTDTQGSATWHIADLNTHLNVYGQTILAGIVQDCIQGRAPHLYKGW